MVLKKVVRTVVFIIVTLIGLGVMGVISNTVKQCTSNNDSTTQYEQQLEQARHQQQLLIDRLRYNDSIASLKLKTVRDSLTRSVLLSQQYRYQLSIERNRPVPNYTHQQLDSAFSDIPRPSRSDTTESYLIKQWRAQYLASMRKSFVLALQTIEQQQHSIDLGQRALVAADSIIEIKNDRIAASDSLTTIVDRQYQHEKQQHNDTRKKVKLWKVISGALGVVVLLLLGGGS